MNIKRAGNIFIYILPLVFWVVVFWEYLSGRASMTQHGIDYYRIIKYIMESFERGVYPLWDFSGTWGRPDYLDVRFISEFNPFHWLYNIFTWIGLSRSLAFLYYAVGYFFLGLYGFYLLAKKLYSDSQLAMIGVSLLLFSSVMLSIFDNLCIVLILVPSIWFYYFLISFLKKPKRRHVLGITFSLMLILTTYMPFYFITVSAPIMLMGGILFFTELREAFERIKAFAVSNKILICICVGALIVATLPGILWLNFAENNDIYTYRHHEAPDQNLASLEYSVISVGGIGGYITLRSLLSGFKYSKYMEFYMPVLVYVLLFLSFLNGIRRRSLICISTVTLVVLICLTDLTPVHKFLYDHVFFFRMFRNIFFLIYLAVPCFIFFVLDQIKSFTIEVSSFQKKAVFSLALIGAHGFMFQVLRQVGDVILTSYVTLGVSCAVFVLFIFRVIGKKIFLFLMLIGVLIQPVEVYRNYINNELGLTYQIVEWTPLERFVPKFSYKRPPRTQFSIMKGREGIQDLPGFVPDKYDGLKWAHQLHQNIDHSVLEQYTQNKFYLYDHVETIDEGGIDFTRIKKAISTNENTAFVFEPIDEFQGSTAYPRNPEVIKDDSDAFQVLEFDLNHIKFRAEVPKSKFLVYNDCYHRNWKAYINGKAVKIYRSNVAFKGIMLPAGTNTVYFKYDTGFQGRLNLFIFAIFYVMFLGLLLAYTRIGSKYVFGQ